MNRTEIIHYLQEKQDFFDKNFGVKFIGLFGSFARDEASKESDIDILYMLEKTASFQCSPI